jgi:hypothetical protein
MCSVYCDVELLHRCCFAALDRGDSEQCQAFVNVAMVLQVTQVAWSFVNSLLASP